MITPFKHLHSERGFSAGELIVVIAIIGIFSLSATPVVRRLIHSYQRQSARQQFESDLIRYRAEALAEGSRIIVTIGAGGSGYSVGIDRLPYSASGQPDATLVSRTLPSKILISASSSIIFNEQGFSVDSNDSLTPRTVTISSDGKQYAQGTVYAVGVFEYA